MAANAKPDIDSSLLHRQQAQIDAMREECEALRECLVATGVLTREKLQAQVHRRRFERVRSRHPLSSAERASLGNVLLAPDLARSIAACSDLRSMRALRGVSHSIGKAAADALPSVDLVAAGLGSVFVCGGYDGSRFLSSVDCFDPEAGAWRPAAPMNGPRESAAVAVLEGQLYAAGGFDGVRRLGAVERFDPRAGQWEKLPEMSSHRVAATAVAFCNKLFVCGGFDGTRYLSSSEAFDPLHGTWQPAPAMAMAREGCAAAVLQGHLYICGGNNGTQTFHEVERLVAIEPLIGAPAFGAAWEQMPSMTCRRDGATAAASCGRLFVCGGFDGAQSLSLRSLERFEPVSRTWRELRPMLARRAGAAAAVVGGKVYVFGGYDGAQNLAECERFDPIAGMWELLPPMPARRGFAGGSCL